MRARNPLIALALPLILLGVSAACGSSKNSAQDDPAYQNALGGDPNVPLGQVGNQVTTLGGVRIGDNWIPMPASMTLVSNDGGLATFHLEVDLSAPALGRYNALIPAEYKDASGKVNMDVKFRITSEGIQDTLNRDRAPHTLVKYDAQVGDQYKLKKSNGDTITRSVTARSTEDDFAWGYMYIKTITIEQDSRIPGIRKLVYRANHRFGIVSFEVVAEDGAVASTLLSSSSY